MNCSTGRAPARGLHQHAAGRPPPPERQALHDPDAPGGRAVALRVRATDARGVVRGLSEKGLFRIRHVLTSIVGGGFEFFLEMLKRTLLSSRAEAAAILFVETRGAEGKTLFFHWSGEFVLGLDAPISGKMRDWRLRGPVPQRTRRSSTTRCGRVAAPAESQPSPRFPSLYAH